MQKTSDFSNAPTPEQIRELRVSTAMTVDSAIKAAGLKTRRSWFTYENGTAMMPPERWRKVLEAVERGDYTTTSRPMTTPDLHVERSAKHALRRMTVGELAEVREGFCELARRLSLSQRELARRSVLNAMSVNKLFTGRMPSEDAYRAVRVAMQARLRELQRTCARLAAGRQYSGGELAEVRGVLGLSQNEFARLLNHRGERVGVTVGEYERGMRQVATERTDGLCSEVERQVAAAADPALWATVFGPLDEADS